MIRRTVRLAATVLFTSFAFQNLFAQEQVEITPSKDNTLYESSTGTLSDGVGGTLYFGLTNQGAIRRALMAFDIAASVPAGATITGAVLQITVTKTIAGSKTVSAHRVQKDWGEGTSSGTGGGGSATTNDATWIHTFFNTDTWQSAGGDFDPGPLTSASAGGTGSVVFPSTPGFVSLVQMWLDTPEENFGLILIGDENSSPSAKAIASRESTGTNKPLLTVTYSVATAIEDPELPSFLSSLDTYPNPVSDVARVSYELSDSRYVRIEMIDITGRIVATPFAGIASGGLHTSEIDASGLTPGVYVVRLRFEDQSVSRTMVVR